MMREAFCVSKLKNFLNIRLFYGHHLGKRTLLSEAYRCEDAWSKRLESPLFKDIKMDQYFVEIDKKIGSKPFASGVDIDLFANNVQNADQLDELEHLLYRFRMTKRSNEMMDSTISSVVRIYLKCKDYESLFRILNDVENYGIFPDFFLYNILMDNFIEQKMFREAAQIAILMMFQEDFSNEIGSILAVYSCHMFFKNNSLTDLYPVPESEKKEEEEDDEEVLERVPFFRNLWFDDHFDLKEPRHLIGKTFFLAGRQMKDELLGKTFHFLGLGMYEKWDAALELLDTLVQSKVPILSEGVEEFKKYMDTLPSEDLKVQFEDFFKKMQENNLVKPGELENHLNAKISEFPNLERDDIKRQEELFGLWENERQLALYKQNLELDKQRRIEEIAKKKEYLFWKEKLLFFFENEDFILEDFKKAEEVAALVKSQKTEDEKYIVPQMVKKIPQKLTQYDKAIRVKKL